MEKMMGLCGLCVQIFALLLIQGIKGSTRLDSLTCANNFKTHWICHWKESAKVNRMLPMELYYRNNIPGSKSQHCTPDNSQNQEDDLLHMSCNFSDTFGSVTGTFTFLPKWTVHAKTHIIPSSKVRIPTPEELTVHVSDNGLIILSWKMPKYAPSSDTLTFQVTYYRKYWETFEDAVSLTVLGEMKVSFNTESMAPGSIYLFRVRSVPHEDPVYRSAWSKELAWAMPEDKRVIPQNLHCEYDGLMAMRCSWKVRKDLVSFVSYALYYTESSADREESCKLNEIKDGVFYVQYSCTFQVSSMNSRNSFNIQLRPVEEVKILEADKNIQLEPPLDLRIEDQLNHGYILSWSPSVVQFSTIQLTYQLCYWKQGEPECPPHTLANVSNSLLEYYIPLSELEGSTNYTAKVRAKPDEEFLYNGPWSGWSERCSWKTHTVGSSETIYISTFIISMVLSVFAFLGCRYFKRLKQRWDDSLPNPSKSKLLLGYRSTIFHPFIPRNFYGEEEQASICVPVSSINTAQSVSEPAEESVKEKASNLLGPYSLVPPTEKIIVSCQSKCQSLDINKTNDITALPALEPIKGPSSKNSNGSYMTYTSGRSMSDLLKKRVADSQYFSIPRCQEEFFSLPKEINEPSQSVASKDQMGYVHSMENPATIQTIQNPENKNVSDKSKYFAIPLPSDFNVPREGPLMIVNPDGSGPLILKQVGDYCFFPGSHGSQDNIERKKTPSSGPKKHQEAPQDPPLSAFKLMQRGYFALPQN